MKKLKGFSIWLSKNLFLVSSTMLGIIYVRWFQIIPIELNKNNFFGPSYRASNPFIVGVILFSTYIFLATATWFAKNHQTSRVFILTPTILVFCVELIFTWIFFPSQPKSARCNETTYYISKYRSLPDPQWSYWQLTKWKGITNYETHFIGNSGISKIICDETNKQANIVNGPGVLIETDGEKPRRFDNYAWAELKDSQYFLASECNNWESGACESASYVLYECKLDYTACNPLSIKYTDYFNRQLILEENKSTNEISLYDDYEDNPNRILIFTYGENPRCYVDKCEILKP